MARNNLLVVDDEPNILSSVRRALELEGYRTHIAGSSSAALERMAQTEFDLVLLDISMPGMTGMELLPLLRQDYPDTAVVMMSGHATVETAVAATKLGAYDFLEKPLSTDKLLLTVKNTLELVRLHRENARLHARLAADRTMIGKSPSMKAVAEKIAKTAPTMGRVLITGENGTGKELVAREIHQQSKRSAAPFIKLNCAAIPTELIESELFGHEKGAFTGATASRRGKFELADGGTLFLDEVGDMNPSAQAKVLRVLQEGELERVGGSETFKVDVRVIAATNRNLPVEISNHRFREDLYYRLNVVPIELPPLRERKQDIASLVEHFVFAACRDHGRRSMNIGAAAVTLLMQHEWPGNVRELRNVVERLVILTGESETIGESDVLAALPNVRAAGGVAKHARQVAFKELVAAAERDIILAALESNDYNVSNTARELQLERSHLYKKMRGLGIDPRADSDAEHSSGGEDAETEQA